MIRGLSFFIALLYAGSLLGQHEPEPHSPEETEEATYCSLREFFRNGEMEFHMRTNWLSTINRGPLSDYSALAAGAGIGYFSPHFHHFGFAMSGFFIFKLYDKNLNGLDPITGGRNRYELALFDMENPENSSDLDRLEELYLEYKRKHLVLRAGRQKIETPFLNSQDNRMRPNIFSGIWANTTFANLNFEGGWINRVSPRGTVDWYDLDESMGVYPFGRNIDGNISEYKHNTSSKGIFILGANWHHQGWESKLVNYYAENIFNLAYADIVHKFETKSNYSYVAGLQGFWQNAIAEGGNPDPAKRYIHKNERTFGLGTTGACLVMDHVFRLNVLYIHDSGRFLFPREWGREQFWTSLPRERFEGNGGLFASSVNWESHWIQNQMETFVGIGYTKNADPEQAKLNKYGMPSWYQIFGRLDYHLQKMFKGLTVSSLILYKGPVGKDPVPDELAINRVNMWQINFIVDYKF